LNGKFPSGPNQSAEPWAEGAPALVAAWTLTSEEEEESRKTSAAMLNTEASDGRERETVMGAFQARETDKNATMGRP
jgi:hypothetical protein